MDQLKPILKYHFWILCGIIVLTTIGAGFWAMSGQASEIQSQLSKINSAQGQAQGVMSVNADVGEEAAVSVHPNANTSEGMNTEISDGKQEVLAAWQELYNEQKDLLGWPLEALPADIAKSFEQFRPERMPFELNSEEWEAPLDRRKQVKQIIVRVLPRLAEAIRAEWQVEDVDAGDSGREPESVDEKSPMEAMMFDQAITEWSYNDQNRWYNRLTQFKGRNGNEEIYPTTMQVLYLKEDLVLLNSVLEILNKVNADATTPGQATVKAIQSILIGKAASSAERLDIAEAASGGGGADSEAAARMQAMKDYAANMGNKGKPGGDKAKKTVSASDKEKWDPANERYVNKNFEPITASEYRAAASATTLSDKSWLSVVKRVPVRLTLKIDERKIDEILEACANAKIPLEVHQLTIVGGDLAKEEGAAGPKKGRTEREGPSAASGGAGGEQMTLSEGSDGGGSGASGAAGGGSGVQSANYKTIEFNSNFDVPVEIYGFMKIYNEPDPAAIGIKQPNAANPAANGTAADGT